MILAISILVGIMLVLLITSFTIKFQDGQANRNSWHLAVYSILWGFYSQRKHNVNLPKNICSYFWTYVLGILLLPINIWGIIVHLFREDDNDKSEFIQHSFMVWFIMMLLFALGMGTFKVSDIEVKNWMLLIAILIGAIEILSVFGAAYGIIKLWEWNKTRIERNEDIRRELGIHKIKKPKQFMLLTMIKSFKEKNCTILKWS